MSTWLVPEDELTPDQLRAVELTPKEHRVILGGPGSGKTLVLVHRARYLRDRYGIKPDRFHIFVYTGVLKQYIRSALEYLDLSESCISTFDSWCARFHDQHISRSRPWDYQRKQPDFAEIRRRVLAYSRQTFFPEPLYDFVLVDEGQDLDGTAFEILRMVSRHITVCMDIKQQVFEGGSDEGTVLKLLGLKQRNVTFLEVFRGCPYVAHLAAEFIPEGKERAFYLRQSKTVQTERQTPLLYLAPDVDHERNRLNRVLRSRLDLGDKVAVLLHQSRQAHGWANKGLRRAGIEVEVQKECDFGTDLPKVLTYPSAKGLTVDSVLLPSLTLKAFGRVPAERIDRLLFVGISRASKWVYLSAVESGALPLEGRLRHLADEGLLTIQRDDGVDSLPDDTEEGPEPPDDDDLLGLL